MEEFKVDEDISNCRVCGKLEVRRCVGYYPDGRNKKFVDASNALWVGRKCPGCIRNKAKLHIKEKRAKKKSEQVGT